MADNIVGSLFGISPEQLMQQRQLRDVEQQVAAGRSAALPGSMMSPSLAPFYQQATQQGQLIGRGVGALLGSEDPELQKVTQIKQLSSQFDLTTSQGMRQFAQALQSIAPNEAMMAAKRADEMEKSGLGLQKTRADMAKAELSAANEEQLRAELAALGPNATEAQVIGVVRKYGSPDKILQVLTQSQDRQAALEQRRATSDLAAATREGTRSAKQMLADEKRQEKLDKQTAAADTAIASSDRLISEVQETKKMVSGFTAGAGSLLSSVPLTEAKDLSKRLTTIKANLGFDRLQQMRDASPTGGALGQVAVQELVALQSTIGSLDQDQSPKQLKDNLDKIELHYTNWRNAVKKAGKASPTADSGGDAGKQGTASNPIVLK